MTFWKRTKKQQPQVDAAFRKMTTAAFPGGEQQIAQEAAEITSLLDGTVPRQYARDILVHAKVRALIAIQSASNSEEAVQRCIDSVGARSQGKLDRAVAEKVAVFAFRRLIDQQDKEASRGSPATWTEMTKEEALEVARLTAYRLARHQGRTNAASQQVYTVDPVTYITETAAQFLTRGKSGRPHKIKTTQDALELSLNVAGMLVVAYAVEKHGTASALESQDMDRLVKEELNRTLELVRNKECVRRYSDYDPSEARAAHEVQVPFNIALALGEVGLLKDSPGPTDTRRKILNDVVNRL